MKIIVAADKNWGIGKDNKLLVSIPADMKMFRQETTGKVCVMGRKTLESFPGGLPLKNRINIVLTRNENYKVKDAIIVHSIEELMEELKKYPAEDVYCIGGDTIYKQLLPYCDAAQVTKIDFAYITKISSVVMAELIFLKNTLYFPDYLFLSYLTNLYSRSKYVCSSLLITLLLLLQECLLLFLRTIFRLMAE